MNALTTLPTSPPQARRDHRPLRIAPRPMRWLAAAGLLLLAGLMLHQRDLTLFLALNALGLHLPELWAMLSVAGLGLSAFIVLAALHPGAAPVAMRPLAALLWCFPIGGALTHLGKRLIDHGRPAALLPHDTLVIIGEPLTRGAMPSGHAATTLAFVALLILSRHRPAWQQALITLIALPLLLARITVGAHWPADLCAGAGVGLVSALLAWHLAGRGRLAAWLCSTPGQWTLGLLQIGCGLAIARLETGYALALPLQALLAVVSIAAGLQRLGMLMMRRQTKREPSRPLAARTAGTR